MARYQAIAATSATLKSVLESALPGTEFVGTAIALFQAKHLQKLPESTTVSLFLYRVAVNTVRRNLPPRLGADGKRYRPSLPLDLHYLLTAWASDAIKQQRLLGWTVRTLENSPILPAGLLNHAGPEPDVFGPDETVELICESLSLGDMASVWEVAKATQQPSVAYVARMITVESDVALTEGPLVQTRDFRFGKGPTQ